MKTLLASIFLAAVGCTVNSFAGELTLNGFVGVGLNATGPVPQAIVTPFSYTSTTAGGPTFNRPIANGNSAPTALSSTGTAVPYDALAFTVGANGSYSFLSVSNTPANWDNYLFLYTGAFTATSPLTNVLIGNDDLGSVGRSGFTLNLTAGTQYILVTTGFSNSNSGSFTNTISAVPEPNAWAMVGAGVFGLAGVQLLRRKHT